MIQLSLTCRHAASICSHVSRTEVAITSAREATEADVDIAVAAARKIFERAWKNVIPEERARCLIRLGDLLEEHIDILADMEALDNGKAFVMAEGDISFAASTLRCCGGWADKIEGRVIDTNRQSFNYTKSEPVRLPGRLEGATAKQLIQLFTGWRLRTDHSVELSHAHVGLEDCPCCRNWMHGGYQDR